MKINLQHTSWNISSLWFCNYRCLLQINNIPSSVQQFRFTNHALNKHAKTNLHENSGALAADCPCVAAHLETIFVNNINYIECHHIILPATYLLWQYFRRAYVVFWEFGTFCVSISSATNTYKGHLMSLSIYAIKVRKEEIKKRNTLHVYANISNHLYSDRYTLFRSINKRFFFHKLKMPKSVHNFRHHEYK